MKHTGNPSYKYVVNMSEDLELQRKINRITAEVEMRQGLGEDKYKLYEAFAKDSKFELIPESEMHKDYHPQVKD